MCIFISIDRSILLTIYTCMYIHTYIYKYLSTYINTGVELQRDEAGEAGRLTNQESEGQTIELVSFINIYVYAICIII